jgi:CheY-like chemotaxis protein
MLTLAAFEFKLLSGMVRKLHVLLVDDDADDRLLFARALRRSGLEVDSFEAADGPAGINYLLGSEPYADRARFPFPDIVFVDLKMPGMDGFDVLKEIRTRLGLQSLPVVVLTNSNLKADVTASYDLRASAFHQKSHCHDDLVSLLQKVIPLWLATTASPRGNSKDM